MKLARVRLADASVVVATVREDGVCPAADDEPGAVLSLLVDRPRTVGARLPFGEVELLCPVVDPPSIRDFMIFEDHVANCRVGTDTEVPKVWYEQPLFYFTNPASLRGPEDPVAAPRGSRALDFELEVACVLGVDSPGDLDPDDPASCEPIAGFMLMNDWSARDLQMREMAGGLGPAKGKDFATSLGPWIVTPDELSGYSAGRVRCGVDVLVNGVRVGGGDLADAHYSWPQVLAAASANTRLRAGDVIGSGTVGTGCLLELRALHGKQRHPWLAPGDRVELRGGPLGSLPNPIA